MDKQNFIETIKWAAQKGLKLYPHMEHKCVDGVYGIYAAADIPKHTVLVSYPLKSILPIREDVTYPKKTDDLFKRLYSATKEYSKGEASEWYGMMRSAESLESLKQTSAYFFSTSELELIKAMNPLLHRVIEERNAIINTQIERLCELDPSIDRNDAAVTALNFKTRSWKEGFLPIFDQFNTSEEFGAKVCQSAHNLFFMTMVDYKAGDQIWISYGSRDIYDYAIDYDFFDPKAVHSICFSSRGSQFTQNEFETSVIRHAATKHKIDISKTDTGLHYQLLEEDARFLEHAPSAKLIEYIQNTAFLSKKEFKTRKCLPSSFDLRLNQILDALLAVNHVDQFTVENIPDKLHRFYYLLKKEKQILLNNKQWAKFNSIHVNEIDPAIRDSVGL